MKYLVLIFILACTPQKVPVETNQNLAPLLVKSEKEMTFDEKIKLQEEVLHRQELELKKQERELLELKRQEIYNKATENYYKKHEVE